MAKITKNFPWMKHIKGIFVTGGIAAIILSFFLERYFQQNLHPVANIVFSAPQTTPNQKIYFDGSSSYDPEGTKLNFEWQVDDQVVSEKQSFTYAFEKTGTHHIKLNVKDKEDLVASKSVFVDVNAPKNIYSLEAALKHFTYKIGWNSDTRSHIRYYKINSISLINNHYAIVKYDYKDEGTLHLILSEHGRKLFGTWHDLDGCGEIELRFNKNYSQATGWWKFDNSNQKNELKLEKI